NFAAALLLRRALRPQHRPREALERVWVDGDVEGVLNQDQPELAEVDDGLRARMRRRAGPRCGGARLRARAGVARLRVGLLSGLRLGGAGLGWLARLGLALLALALAGHTLVTAGVALGFGAAYFFAEGDRLVA